MRDTSGQWTQQAYLKASNTESQDRFGSSVAISGGTIVVGAPWESSSVTGANGNQTDNLASQSGAAYVFVRDDDGQWNQQVYLKADDIGAGDQFGTWVDVDSDLIVVGSPYEDSSATGVGGDDSDNSLKDSGAAYVFVRTGTAWAQQAYLKAWNTGAADYFGISVTVSGETVAVAASGEDTKPTTVTGNQNNNSAGDSGAVYVFVRGVDEIWSQQEWVKGSNTAAGDLFGISVALSGDRLVVGARGEDSDSQGNNERASGAGAAYSLIRTGGTWSQEAYYKASNADRDDLFGSSVGVDHDTIVVGAYYEDSNAQDDTANNSAVNSGAAYLFFPTSVDLGICKSADVRHALPGDTVVFTLTVTNNGSTAATGVTVTDSLPEGLTYSSSDCGGSFVAPTLTWTLGNLAASASATCRITVTIDAGASGEIVNSATVAGDQSDSTEGNDEDDARLTVTQ